MNLPPQVQAFLTWFNGLESARRMWFLAIAGLGLASLAVAFGVATYQPMVPLFKTSLDSASSTEVMNYLESKEIVYDIERGSDRILVPDQLADSLRMQLTGNGMVSSKNVGLELFEENRFGSTKFVEHVRYVRGLQGELERSINGFDTVRSSKVLLSMPEESLFAEEEVDPSASVYLELKSGVNLSAAEGKRIANLVANAVPRLTSESVEILDSEMRVIHASNSVDGEAKAASNLTELKQGHERYYKREIERILERVVGPGKVVARVNVVLDNAQRSLDERKLHPDGAVAVSTQTFEESSTSAGRATGITGTTANLAEAKAANAVAQGSGSETSSSREIGNFDVPHTWRSEATLPGSIQSISAAVLVDGTWTEVAAVEGEKPVEGVAAEKTYVPRTEDELAAYASLVASALGVDAKAVTMVNQPFTTIDIPQGKSTSGGLALGPDSSVQSYMRYAFALLALVMTFGFIVRPVMKNITVPDEAALDSETPQQLAEGTASAGSLPSPDEQDAQVLADLIDRIGSGNEHITRGEVSRLVSSDITHSLVTLQAWLAEEDA